MDDTAKIAEANEAERVLNSPVIQKALKNMREAYVNGLANTDFGDQRRVDRLHTMLVLLKEFEGHLRATVGQGKVVAFNIDQEKHSFLGDVFKRKQV